MKAVSILLSLLLIEAFAVSCASACPGYKPQSNVRTFPNSRCIHTKPVPNPRPSFYTPQTTFHRSKTQIHTYTKAVPRENYIWEAETKEDIKIKNEIEKAQIDFGVDSKEAGQLMMRHARNYLASKKYKKAIELTDEIIKVNRCFKNGIEGVSLTEVHKLRGEALFRMKPKMVVTTVSSDQIPCRELMKLVMPKYQTLPVKRGVLLRGKSGQKKLISKL